MTILNFPLGVWLSLTQFLIAFFLPQVSLPSLGFLLCIAPLVGVQVANGCVVAWLLGDVLHTWKTRKTIRPGTDRDLLLLSGSLILIAVFILGLCLCVRSDVDWSIISALYRYGGLRQTLVYIIHSHDRLVQGLLLIIGYVVSFVLAARIAKRVSTVTRYQLGLGICLAVIANCFVLVCQINDFLPLFSRNRTAFWLYVGRYPAAFSDPNAFGVAGFLVFALLFPLTKGATSRVFWAAAALMSVIEIWSGSRTFWIGLIIFSLLYFWLKRNGSSARRPRLLAGVLAALLGLMLLGEPHINGGLQTLIPTPSTTRLLRSINWQEARSMSESRFIFSAIAFETWRMSPFYGVGLNRFYDFQVQSAKKLGIELKDWRDNANNYYLQLLSEEGIIGFLLLLIAFYFFVAAVRVPADDSESMSPELRAVANVSCLTLMTMGILLCTGPHLYFDEVRHLLAVVLGLAVGSVSQVSVGSDKMQQGRILITIAIGLSLLYLGLVVKFPAKPLVSGVYDVEQGQEGRYVWTVDAAKISLCPKVDEPARVALKTLKPDVTQNPQFVELSLLANGSAQDKKSLVLHDSDWHTVDFLRGSAKAGDRLELRLYVSPLWNPIANGSPSGDNRFLGVMLEWPRNVCTGNDQ